MLARARVDYNKKGEFPRSGDRGYSKIKGRVATILLVVPAFRDERPDFRKDAQDTDVITPFSTLTHSETTP